MNQPSKKGRNTVLIAAALCSMALHAADRASDLERARKQIRHVVVILQENLSLERDFGVNSKATQGGSTAADYGSYARRYAMGDRYFDGSLVPSAPENGAVQPMGDVCNSASGKQAHMTGRNIGDLLSEMNVSWGFFQGGFDLTVVNQDGSTGCQRSSVSPWMKERQRDYLPQHEPFQYYASTANPKHVRPISPAMVGRNDDGGANHQYDTHDFFDAVRAGNFPAVSFLKAAAYEDGHAGYSSLLDQQRWVVRVMNYLEKHPEWPHTIVILAHDGWATAKDTVESDSQCGNGGKAGAQGPCGAGPHAPLLVISPWARSNYVDHTMTNQASILLLIENIFLNGRRIGGSSLDAGTGSLMGMFDFSRDEPRNARPLILNPNTGEPVKEDESEEGR